MIASNSKIQCYKSCRRLYELRYIYKVYPVRKAEALERGTSYHDAVEQLLNGKTAQEIDDPKIRAMVWAFSEYIMPQIAQHKVKSTEEWFERPTRNGHNIVGRFDAECADAIVEHKTTSQPIDGVYFANLENDEQIMTYMWASGKRQVLYTVCRVPTIRKKKDESDDEFEERCKDWYSEETDSKIVMQVISRTDEEVEEFGKTLCNVVDEMNGCKLFYRNPNHCMKWGRLCDYAPICKHYDPNLEYVDFTRETEARL